MSRLAQHSNGAQILLVRALMAKRIAALVCTISMIHASVGSAQGLPAHDESNARAVSVIDRHDGPLRRAAFTLAPSLIPRATATVGMMSNDVHARRPWIERHPVLTGTVAGFGIGFGLTYAIAHDDRDEFLTPVSTGAAALFWGGISAALGALAGWGVGRSR
jgi:hypothetical protein